MVTSQREGWPLYFPVQGVVPNTHCSTVEQDNFLIHCGHPQKEQLYALLNTFGG